MGILNSHGMNERKSSFIDSITMQGSVWSSFKNGNFLKKYHCEQIVWNTYMWVVNVIDLNETI